MAMNALPKKYRENLQQAEDGVRVRLYVWMELALITGSRESRIPELDAALHTQAGTGLSCRCGEQMRRVLRT